MTPDDWLDDPDGDASLDADLYLDDIERAAQ